MDLKIRNSYSNCSSSFVSSNHIVSRQIGDHLYEAREYLSSVECYKIAIDNCEIEDVENLESEMADQFQSKIEDTLSMRNAIQEKLDTALQKTSEESAKKNNLLMETTDENGLYSARAPGFAV